MLRSRLFWEIVAPFFTCALLAAGFLLWQGGRARREALEDALFRRLVSTGSAIGMHGELFRRPAAQWSSDLSQLARRSGLRLGVISGDGTPLVDTEIETGLLSNAYDQPEFQKALRDGVGRKRTNDHLIAVVRTREAGAATGFVRLEAPLEPIKQSVARWRRRAGFGAGVVAAAGLVWTVIVARRLSYGVSTMTSAIETTLETDVAPKGGKTGRSLAKLSAAFGELTTQLARRIAALRQDNATLRQDQEQLSTILAGMAEGVLAVDRNELVLFANRAVAALLDVSEQKLVGRPLWEVVRLPAIQESTRAALAGQETGQSEINVPRSQIVLALRARRLPGRDVPGAVLVLHDITELKRLENLRREFVSNVSHELKTPLASIQAYTDTLLAGAIHDADHNERFLHRIDEQANRLHNLILDLLRLARIEAGTDVFEIQKLTAAKMIEPCVAEHATRAEARGLKLAVEPPSEPIRLRADPEGLRTIMDNLIDNALHYTPEGGRVTIRWMRRDGMALIEVADTGIGIPPEHLQRIFERFHRVDKARSRERGGTGLGLAIVKHLVQVFDGHVEVESEVGAGSMFRVYLPAGD